jgi:hypothetical protein
MYSVADTPKGWVAPFGYPRINACSRLPVAFRSVPRPSSPPGAKASTECPYLARSLTMHGNHPQIRLSPDPRGSAQRQTQSTQHTTSLHTPLNTRRTHEGRHEPIRPATIRSDLHAHDGTKAQPRNHGANAMNQNQTPSRAPRSAPEPIHPDKEQHHHPYERTATQPARPRPSTHDVEKQNGQTETLGFTAIQPYPRTQHQPRRWWRRSGSNRRPPACKAGALPAELRPQKPVGQTIHGPEAPARNHLVGQGGFEPPTPRLSSVCSNQLSY